MSTKKRILVTLIVAVLAAIVIFPMLPLEYRDRIVAILTHPLYYLGLSNPTPFTHNAAASEILDNRRAGTALACGCVAPGLEGPQERGGARVLEADRPVLRHRCTKHASSTAVFHHRYSHDYRNLDRIPPLPYP